MTIKHKFNISNSFDSYENAVMFLNELREYIKSNTNSKVHKYISFMIVVRTLKSGGYFSTFSVQKRPLLKIDHSLEQFQAITDNYNESEVSLDIISSAPMITVSFFNDYNVMEDDFISFKDIIEEWNKTKRTPKRRIAPIQVNDAFKQILNMINRTLMNKDLIEDDLIQNTDINIKDTITPVNNEKIKEAKPINDKQQAIITELNDLTSKDTKSPSDKKLINKLRAHLRYYNLKCKPS
jgi:hypothetical protein